MLSSHQHAFAKSTALVTLLFLAKDLSPCTAQCSIFGVDYNEQDAIQTILKCNSDGTYDGHKSTCKNAKFVDEEEKDMNCPQGERCVEDEETNAPACVVDPNAVEPGEPGEPGEEDTPGEDEDTPGEDEDTPGEDEDTPGEDEDTPGEDEQVPDDVDLEQVQPGEEDIIPNEEQDAVEGDQSDVQDPLAENEPPTTEQQPDDVDSEQEQDQEPVVEEQDAAEEDQSEGQDIPAEDEPPMEPENPIEETPAGNDEQDNVEEQSEVQDSPAEDESLTEQVNPEDDESTTENAPPAEDEPAITAEADKEQIDDNENLDEPDNEAAAENEDKDDKKKQNKKDKGCVMDGKNYAIGEALNYGIPTNMSCLSEFSYQGLVATCGEDGNFIMETNGYDCPDEEMYCNQCDGMEMVVPCRKTQNCTEGAPGEKPVDVPYENENDCLVNYKAQDTIGYVGVRCIDNITMEVWKTKCFDDGTIGVDTENEEQETCPTEKPYCVPCGSERRAGAALCLETPEVPTDCEGDEFDPTTDLNDEPDEEITEDIIEDGDEEEDISLISDSSFDMDSTRDSIRATDSSADFKSLCANTKLISEVLCVVSALLFH